MNRILAATATLAACAFFCAAGFAQIPPAGALLPSGFSLVSEKNFASSTRIEATRPNEGILDVKQDNPVRLTISWSRSPSPEETVQKILKAPEDAAGATAGGTRREPCGKKKYHGGVFSCQKIVTPGSADGKTPGIVTWEMSWVGPNLTGLVNVAISGYRGPRETAEAWMDSVISALRSQ